MIEETENNRRASDKLQTDIDLSIAAENDPRQRALLIILQSINRSLIANTRATQDTAEGLKENGDNFKIHLSNFEKHAINEEALMNKGRGAWWVLTIALTIAQSFVIYAWRDSKFELDAMKAESRAASILHEKMQARIEYLEKAK